MTKISIIIPVYNDKKGLKKTLISLNNQIKGPFDQEIVIQHDKNGEGSYKARNEAIDKSTGQILAFIDAGTIAKENWLIKGFEYIERYDYVGGKIKLKKSNNSFISNLLWTYASNREFAVSEFVKNSHFAPTTNLFIKKVVFEKAGPFDKRLKSSGDLEFGNRIFNMGFTQYYAKDLVVTHETRTFSEYVKKHKRLAKGFFDLYTYFPNKYSSFKYNFLKALIPPVWLYTKDSWVRLGVRNKIVVFCMTYVFSVVQHLTFTKHYFLRILKFY